MFPIGEKIKELRNMQGLTQEELASRCELSKGFISQVERDLTSPSIATLMDILQGLGTTASQFFQEEPEEEIVFTPKDYFEKVDQEYRNKIEWVIPNAQKNRMEPIRLTLEKGGQTAPDTPHDGEEFGYVLKGSVVLHVGSRHFTVKAGHSFYYTADKEHYITSKEGATLIWVSTPPNF